MDVSAITDVSDQISEYCPRPSISQNSLIQEVLDDLKCEVRELSKEICVSGKNDYTLETLNPDRTVAVPERSVMLKHKTSIVNGLRIGMEMMKSADFPRSLPEVVNAYTTEVESTIQDTDRCILRRAEAKETAQNEINWFENNSTDLLNFQEGFKNSKDDSIDRMEPLINHDFNMIRKTFYSFLDLISPSKALKEILGDLVRKSDKEGDDQYLDINEDNFAIITTLIKAFIIERHPLVSTKVRLTPV